MTKKAAKNTILADCDTLSVIVLKNTSWDGLDAV